ncbi:MAG: EAL domain-containing protein [Inhella sp.]
MSWVWLPGLLLALLLLGALRRLRQARRLRQRMGGSLSELEAQIAELSRAEFESHVPLAQEPPPDSLMGRLLDTQRRLHRLETERRETVQRLQLAAGVFTHAREGIMITDATGLIVDVNEAFTRVTGYSRDELMGRSPRLLDSGRHPPEYYQRLWQDLQQQGQWQGEIWDRRKGGELFASLETISAVRNEQGQITHYISLMTDITALKEQAQRLEHIAHYDALTALPNRVLLADRLKHAMVMAPRHAGRIAIAYLDLDGFKEVNDEHGHDAGDRLLVELSTRMRQVLREGDTLARLGGDEFVVVLLDLPDEPTCDALLTRMLREISQPFQLDGASVQVSGSLGVTFYPQADEVDADQLLRQADQAMYQAKVSGKNRYHVFDIEEAAQVRGQLESVESLRLALERREFILHYQPKVNLRTGKVIGAEALIRWQHPQRGLLAPGQFLPLIEDHPLICDLGHWVIEAALQQMSDWREQGLHLPVSVNVAARQLQQSDFVARVLAAIARHPGLYPQDLQLEVLETSALEDLVGVSRTMVEGRGGGLVFALDDFGTGYSSLTYLKRLPVAQLKIDQSFVRDMLDDADDLAILDGVIGLAAAFRREVIAEGVESTEHGAVLLQLGCELAQGYGIARPMPAAELPRWVDQWNPPLEWQGLQMVSRENLPLLRVYMDHRACVRAVARYLQGQREQAPQPLAATRLAEWLHSPTLDTPRIDALRQRHAEVLRQAEWLLQARERGEILTTAQLGPFLAAEAALGRALRAQLQSR